MCLYLNNINDILCISLTNNLVGEFMNDFNEPLYQKIYNSIIEDIDKGIYKAGDRIPSEKELAERFNVSRITSKKAMEMLADNKLIVRMPGKGSFVRGDKADEIAYETNDEKIKGPSYLIGVILPDFSESYGVGLISGIEKEASKNGYFIVPRRSYGLQNYEEEAIEALISSGVDGIIIMPVYGEYYSPRILRLVLDQFPIVIIDRQLKGIPSPFVGTDNVQATKMGIDYLLELGHRAISILSPPPNNTSTIENRIEGFLESYADHGLVADKSIWMTDLICTLPSNNGLEHIREDMDRVKQLLLENPQITCLFAIEYNIAILAHQAIREIGKKVPEDISILCFDGPGNFIGEHYLTHIRQSEEQMGSTAFDMLQKNMEDSERVAGEIFIDAALIKGTSTAPIK